MRADEYADFVTSRFKRTDMPIPALVHAVMGISGEAGELMDAVKKHVAYGKPLDGNNMIEELGDLMFYVQATLNELGLPLQYVLSENVRKLTARYPEKYTDELAIARLDKQ